MVETAARSGNAPPKVPAKPQTAPSPKTALLEKKLAAVQQKFEAAKASGAATKNLEDKIYEIEDAIRLSTSAG